MKRGDIYIIEKRRATGSETQGARPGIIVSNDVLNSTSPVVEVVYCTTRHKKRMPTHATIKITGTCSTVLCEQVDSVDTTLISKYLGRVTPEELKSIDDALSASLGLHGAHDQNAQKPKENDPVNHPSHYTSGKIEVIDFIEDKELSYHLGNVVKYVVRAGKKDPSKTTEDLRKAVWYLTREIQKQEGATE